MDYVMIREVKELRERLHQIPERSLMEEQTKKELMCFLKEHTSFQVTDRGKWFYAWKPAKNAEQKKPPVAFRADMDAVCGRDGKPGHYCGHDGHCSILAGLALSLENGLSPDRYIYLIFQPAEETGQGARLVSSLLSEKQISACQILLESAICKNADGRRVLRLPRGYRQLHLYDEA